MVLQFNEFVAKNFNMADSPLSGVIADFIKSDFKINDANGTSKIYFHPFTNSCKDYQQ